MDIPKSRKVNLTIGEFVNIAVRRDCKADCLTAEVIDVYHDGSFAVKYLDSSKKLRIEYGDIEGFPSTYRDFEYSQ